MKVNKTKIPFESEEFEKNYSPTEEEVSYLESLVKQNKIKELEDYVNKKMIGRELDAFHPGIPTRDYLASALTTSIKNKYPELKKMTEVESFNFLKNRVYPGLDDLKSKFGLSNEADIAPYNEDSYTPIGKVNAGKINLNSENKDYIDSALHELAHSIDDPIKYIKKNSRPYGDKTNLDIKKSALEEFAKKNPKIKKLIDSENSYTTKTEALARYKNIARSPNFEDYDWKSGEFQSDVIQNPIDKYKEVGGEHHMDRPFSLDNFINFNKGDLKDIVKNEQDQSKFPKIKKLIG
jgi:hypothetical protein